RDDLLAFYQDDPNDPFRSLWLYLVDKEIDPKKALTDLRQRYQQAKGGQWGWNIAEFYLGDISEKTLLDRLKEFSTDNTSLAEHLSETYFYLGKYYLSLGDTDSAETLFKLTVANNAHNFVEHRYALLELALLGDEEQDLTDSDPQ
ncbi:lipoprotein NlpI, partial [Salmonella enterica subsp. enterica serovar Enteritidis]|nr:lipoprotein NlpI [Salmonella enterica subsp. enterica serovar Enteritidis]